MDIAPLGYLSIAAHGHADALAVTWSRGGADIISDPGTGSYYGHPDWRAVMRSTGAHSTVCVDGEDQSVSGGPFMWTRHARVKVLGVDLAAGVVDAQHDGYRRLSGGITHRRWLISPPTACAALVVELIDGEGTHVCQQNWPLHPDIDIEAIAHGHLLTRGAEPVGRMLYAASAGLEIAQRRGDGEANAGWWSDCLESRVPTWWLSASSAAELPLVMATLLELDDRFPAQGLSATHKGGVIKVEWMQGWSIQSMSIDTGRAAAVSVAGGIELE